LSIDFSLAYPHYNAAHIDKLCLKRNGNNSLCLCIRVNSNKKRSSLTRKALSPRQRIVIQMLPSVPCSLLKTRFPKQHQDQKIVILF